MTKPTALILTVEPDTSEMEELVYSLGYEVSAVVQQNRGRPDPQFFLGRGKLEEARALAHGFGVDVIVVNETLKPNQIFNISDFVNAHFDDGESRAAADAGLVLDDWNDDASAGGASAAERPGVARSTGRSRRDGASSGRARSERLEVYDRLRVILEIFTERARSPEARLQVDLAKLQYEMPIVKEYIHLAKKGEHPGFLAGGEYEVNQYYTIMKKRIAKIRRDLDRISLERDVRRKHRRKSGFHLVSLAGYTNAGKSSLLRALATKGASLPRTLRAADGGEDGRDDDRRIARDDRRSTVRDDRPHVGHDESRLRGDDGAADVATRAREDAGGAAAAPPDVPTTVVHDIPTAASQDVPTAASQDVGSRKGYRGEDILVENRYFSTLATRTRRAESSKRELLVTDTVGFIEDLPPWVIEAFHSTLEEIALADVILLVADSSDPLDELTRKLRASLNTLWEFDSAVGRSRRGSRRAAMLRGSVKPPAAPTEAHTENRGDTAPTSGEEGPAGGADERGGEAEADGTKTADGAEIANGSLTPLELARGPGGLAPILVVLNKVDKLTPEDLTTKVRALRSEGLVGSNWIGVSARQRLGLDELYERLYEALPEYVAFELALPPSPESEAFVAWAYEHGDVLDLTRGNETHLHFEVKATLREEVEARATACGATPLREIVRHTSWDDAESSDAMEGGDAPVEDVARRVLDEGDGRKEHEP